MGVAPEALGRGGAEEAISLREIPAEGGVEVLGADPRWVPDDQVESAPLAADDVAKVDGIVKPGDLAAPLHSPLLFSDPESDLAHLSEPDSLPPRESARFPE